jgi:hypothetical protein
MSQAKREQRDFWLCGGGGGVSDRRLNQGNLD